MIDDCSIEKHKYNLKLFVILKKFIEVNLILIYILQILIVAQGKQE